jgi:hypothetical protein
MKEVIHDGEAADSYREDVRKFFEALLDPISAAGVAVGFAEQERATDATCDAVLLRRIFDDTSA